MVHQIDIDKKLEELGCTNEYNVTTNDFRPKSFDEFIGNKDAVNLIKLNLCGSLARGEIFPHTMLSAYSGCGKTTLAYIIAAHQKGTLISTGMPMNVEELHEILRKVEEGDVVLLDEVHLQTQPELLYSLLEEGTYTLNAETYTFPKFTFIGATTEIGEVKTPLRNRFPLSIQLARYSISDMEQIVRQCGKKSDIPITDEAVHMLATASNRIPREANSLVTNCLNMVAVLEADKIGLEVVIDVLKLLKLTKDGLSLRHLVYLQTMRDIFDCGRTGVSAISATLGENKKTIELTVEPQLIQSKLVIKTPRGRQISESGLARLEDIDAQELLHQGGD